MLASLQLLAGSFGSGVVVGAVGSTVVVAFVVVGVVGVGVVPVLAVVGGSVGMSCKTKETLMSNL